jgi:hypothetical protein
LERTTSHGIFLLVGHALFNGHEAVDQEFDILAREDRDGRELHLDDLGGWRFDRGRSGDAILFGLATMGWLIWFVAGASDAGSGGILLRRVSRGRNSSPGEFMLRVGAEEQQNQGTQPSPLIRLQCVVRHRS